MKGSRVPLCLVLVAFVVISGLNFAEEQQDFRQIKSTDAVRTASLAAGAFKIDERVCPPVHGVVTTDEIAYMLEPMYVATLPRFDAWGNPLRYWVSDGDCWVASYGPDGIADETSPDGDDILFRSGKAVDRQNPLTLD